MSDGFIVAGDIQSFNPVDHLVLLLNTFLTARRNYISIALFCKNVKSAATLVPVIKFF